MNTVLLYVCTCEPDRTAAEAATLAKHLSPLVSGHVMSLIGHIGRPSRHLKTHTHVLLFTTSTGKSTATNAWFNYHVL